MGKIRKTNNDRIWKLGQQKARSCSENLAREIKKTKKAGITNLYINQTLTCLPNFLGCIPEDHFGDLVIKNYPAFVIANIDSHLMKGSHWLAIGIFKNSIEIFDPLGFKIFNWKRVPCKLLSFLHRMSLTRRVQVSQLIQSQNSHLCGYYCIFYLILRSFTSLRTIVSFFYSLNSKLYKNDLILCNFFK